MKQNTPKKIVLAYSGGLDTSVILPWLRETYKCPVIAFAAELGQGRELKGIRRKALASGAGKCVVADLREEFARDYLWPMLRSGAVYDGPAPNQQVIGHGCLLHPLLLGCRGRTAV